MRVRAIERDAFTDATGYPAGILVDGIALRDRVWLDRPVSLGNPAFSHAIVWQMRERLEKSRANFGKALTVTAQMATLCRGPGSFHNFIAANCAEVVRDIRISPK